MKTRCICGLALVALDLVLIAPVFAADKAGSFQKASCCGPTLQTAADPLTKGDVNCSGTVDLADALLILRSVSGLPVSAGCLAERGDVDCSGTIDGADALQILRHLAGKPALLPSNCPPIGGWTLTSFEKIDQALGAGKIDGETALVYKVYATFSDKRLPTEYQGDDRYLNADSLMIEAGTRFPTLSATNQAIVKPFLLSPLDAESWFQKPASGSGSSAASYAADWPASETWVSNDSSSHVRVWFRPIHAEDELRAADIAEEIDAVIWPKLTEKFGLPDPDFTTPGADQTGRVNIFLVDESVSSYSIRPLMSFCKTSSGVIFLGHGKWSNALVAHHLMHVILFSAPLSGTGCIWPEYTWLHEATAQWAMDYVYPDANEEWPNRREEFLSQPWLPLEYRDGKHEYDAYLWNFFLVRVLNKLQLVYDTWANAGLYDSLGTINQSLLGEGLGGFKDQWPEFALYNYNRPPAPLDSYATLDSIPFHAEVEEHTPSADAKWIQLKGDVGHLSARYYRFKFTDSRIQSAIFTHPFAKQPTAKVQALVKLKGRSGWKIEKDWTKTALRRFCFAKPEENLEELVIIVSNSEYQDRTHVLKGTPVLGVFPGPVPCTDFIGTFEYTYERENPATKTSITETTTAIAFFKRDQTVPSPTGYDSWIATDGVVFWNWDGTFYGCSGHTGAQYPVQPGDAQLTFITSGSSTKYSGNGGTLYYYSLTLDCPAPEKDIDYENVAMPTWFNTGPVSWDYQPGQDGSIEGGFITIGAYGALETWGWTLLPVLR